MGFTSNSPTLIKIADPEKKSKWDICARAVEINTPGPQRLPCAHAAACVGAPTRRVAPGNGAISFKGLSREAPAENSATSPAQCDAHCHVREENFRNQRGAKIVMLLAETKLQATSGVHSIIECDPLFAGNLESQPYSPSLMAISESDQMAMNIFFGLTQCSLCCC